MIKLILVGVWACAVTLGSSYAVALFSASGTGHDSHSTDKGHGPKSEKSVEHLRPRMISVPVIAEGAVRGYVVAQFVLSVDAKELRQLGMPPEPLFLDEAFKAIYADEAIDFRRFRKQDLAALGKRIQAGANKRFGANLIQDVLIQELNYVPKDEARGRIVQ
ncbi:MAG TPA: hypothetical protein VNK52_16380 [Hyphomicrobiaceae bacterium]|nr:hypothetical protein [Hyphomicrobiaceae bacterium]